MSFSTPQSKPLITVVGATGAQGSSVVHTFLSACPSWRIRGLTRNPSSAASKALAAKGVEMVAADLNDPSTLPAAFAGATAIHLRRHGFLGLVHGTCIGPWAAAPRAQARPDGQRVGVRARAGAGEGHCGRSGQGGGARKVCLVESDSGEGDKSREVYVGVPFRFEGRRHGVYQEGASRAVGEDESSPGWGLCDEPFLAAVYAATEGSSAHYLLP
jgi:NmrA-like family